MEKNELVEIKTDLSKPIRQSNRLIEANYYLTALEQKVILFFISQLDGNSEDFCTMKIGVNELAEAIGIGKDRYSVLNHLTDELMSKVLTIKAGNDWYKTHWVQSAKYTAGEGTISIRFDESLKPDLLRLQKAYVSGNAELCLSFKGKYTARFYMLIKQYERIGKRLFKIEELIDRFQIGNTYGKRISNIKGRIIEPALNEIKEKSDIDFEYEYIKAGRSIVGLLVTGIRSLNQGKMSSKTGEDLAELEEMGQTRLFDVTTFEENEIVYRLSKYDISPKKADDLIRHYGMDRIDRNLKYAYKNKQGKKSMSGWIISCVEQDHAAAAEEADSLRKKAAEKERAELLARVEPMPEVPELPVDSPFRRYLKKGRGARKVTKSQECHED